MWKFIFNNVLRFGDVSVCDKVINVVIMILIFK